VNSENNIYAALAATAQAMGQQITPEAARLIADDLSDYTPQRISEALKRLRRKGGRFSVAGILEYIDATDGRPSADKAWAIFPKDEADSAVISQEMAGAWSVASDQYFAGDLIGAQIAFKREYAALIERARDDGKSASWFPSLGHEPSRRADAIAEAVELGRLPMTQAVMLMHDQPKSISMIAERAERAGVITRGEMLMIAPPVTVDEAGRARVAEMIGGIRRKITSNG